MYQGAQRLPNGAAIFAQNVSPEAIRLLQDTKTLVQIETWSYENGTCLVSSGIGSAAPQGKTPRAPFLFRSSLSTRGANEAESAPCERAFEQTLKLLTQNGVFDRKVLEEHAAATSDAAPAEFPKYTAGQDTIMTWSGPFLSEAGKRVVNESLGARWYTSLDYRKYLAHVTLMLGDTVEGKSFCAVRYGISTTPPRGRTARLPAQSSLRYLELDKGADCPIGVVRMAAEALGAQFENLLGRFDMVAEAGQTYPTPEDIKKSVARYDARNAAATPAPPPADRQVSSTTRSTNILTCKNDCYNGACVRTFPDGRTERWQAPRRYSPLTRNWEYDTTTNACGV